MADGVIVKKGVVKKKVTYEVPNCNFVFTQEDLDDKTPFNFQDKRAFFNWLSENKEAQGQFNRVVI